MPQSEPETAKMPETFSIRKLDDGTFVLSESGPEGSYEYSYDNVDDLLNSLRDDLSGDAPEEKDEQSPQKKMAKEVTSMEDSNEE